MIEDNVEPIEIMENDQSQFYDQFQGMKIIFDEKVGLFPVEVIQVEKVGDNASSR